MSGKILLIDGDNDYIKELSDTLVSDGFDCTTAVTAKEGFEILKTGSFDGAILEIMLEDISSGFRVAKYIKEESSNQQCAVLMVSAMKTLTDLDFSERIDNDNLPVDRLLHKPVKVEEIVSSLKEILGSA